MGLINRIHCVLLITLFLFFGCLEDNRGYYGADGELLLEYLPPSALLDLTENPDPQIRIIDVRSLAEYQSGHIPLAESFPANEIESRLNELSIDDYLILHCHTGLRAQAVIIDILEPNSYTRFMNWGGTIHWPYDFVQ